MRLEDDFVLRQIDRLRQMVARLAGVPEPKQVQALEEEIDTAYGRLLNCDRELFATLSAASIAGMLRDADRIALVANVMQVEGDLVRLRGDRVAARRLHRRAARLLAAIPTVAGGGVGEPRVSDDVRTRLDARLVTLLDR